MKVGDIDKCADCGSSGVVVTTSLEGHDFDKELSRRVAVALEPSAYSQALTCRPCEATRLRAALPKRGVCPACGKQSQKAVLMDLSGTRSFCDDKCRSDFLNHQIGRQA